MSNGAAPSPRSLVGMGSEGQSTTIRTDDDGFLITVSGEPLPAIDDYWYVFDRATLAVIKRFLIRVGAEPIDFWWNVTTGVTAPVDFVENVTVSAEGTPVSVFNFNRSSVASPTFEVFVAPTVSSGTTILQTQSGFGLGITPVSGNARSTLAQENLPWRLKANTDYTLAYTPVASIVSLFNAVFREVN